MDELLKYEWFAQSNQMGRLTEDRQLNISANLASFAKTTTFQSGVCSIIANLQTKAEELSECREMFLKFDANNDGFITLDELQSGYQDLQQIFHMQAPDVMALMKSADLNGDGRIDYAEFIAAAYEKSLLLSQQNLRAAFNMMDVDGDGTLTKDELMQVFGDANVTERGEQIWDEIVASVDSNNDGIIDFEEFERAMKSVLRQRATFADRARRKD